MQSDSRTSSYPGGEELPDDPSIPSPTKPMPRELDVGRPDAHFVERALERYSVTLEPTAKMVPSHAALYNETAPSAKDLRIKVYTVGEPYTHQVPPNPEVPEGRQLHGFRPTQQELEQLRLIGYALGTPEIGPVVFLTVPTKDDIGRVAALPFVYTIQMPRPLVSASHVGSPDYSVPFNRFHQKIDEHTWNVWASRDADDGSQNGRMPDNVTFAVIDRGYDHLETRHNAPYAASQVDHCHKWVGGVMYSWDRTTASDTVGSVCGEEAEQIHTIANNNLVNTINTVEGSTVSDMLIGTGASFTYSGGGVKFGSGLDSSSVGPAAYDNDNTFWDFTGDLSMTGAFTADTTALGSTLFGTLQGSPTATWVPCVRFGISTAGRWFYHHSTNNAGTVFSASSAALATAGFHTFTLRRDDSGTSGGSVVIEVDNVVVISATYGPTQTINCTNTSLFRALTNNFDGKIYELRIWKNLQSQALLDSHADPYNLNYRFVPQKTEDAAYFFGVYDDNAHGTIIADTMDLDNKGGGTIHVYNFAVEDDFELAYRHILAAHSDTDVISTSIGKTAWYIPDNPQRPCIGDFDDVLRDLVWYSNTYISGAESNPGGKITTFYPSDSIWAISTGGVTTGSPWQIPSGTVAGVVNLDPNECSEQHYYHTTTDGRTTIFKPDVYSFHYNYVDHVHGGSTGPAAIGGNSFGQPHTASGLGSIVSRFRLGQTSWIPHIEWTGSCYQGVVKLAWESDGPDGRGINPASAYSYTSGSTFLTYGRLQDHDAWYNNGYTC